MNPSFVLKYPVLITRTDASMFVVVVVSRIVTRAAEVGIDPSSGCLLLSIVSGDAKCRPILLWHGTEGKN